jgi:NDP-sugar pyrophosphorylase family protein
MQALPQLGDAFFVLYGDSFLPIDYLAVADAWQAGSQPALMTVFHNADAWDTSNVQFEDGRILRYDKRERTPAMRHIDYGLSVFRRDVFAPWAERGAFDLSDVQRALVADGKMAGYEVTRRFYEIGSHAGLAELEQLLQTGTPL